MSVIISSGGSYVMRLSCSMSLDAECYWVRFSDRSAVRDVYARSANLGSVTCWYRLQEGYTRPRFVCEHENRVVAVQNPSLKFALEDSRV